MTWIDYFSLSEIHREVYAAIIESYIPHGKRGDFAGKIGISREYLSYLCAQDDPFEGKYPTKRLPSSQLAKRIANMLPAPTEIRHSLQENMELAHLHTAKAYYKTQDLISNHNIQEMLHELQTTHQLAGFGKQLLEVKRAYKVVNNAAKSLLPHLSLEMHPVSFAQTCLYINDTQCILDRADDALRYAKLAYLVIKDNDTLESGYSKEQIDQIEINAIRGIAIAYHNLDLDREAKQIYNQVTSTPAYKNYGILWKPLVGRDIVNSLSKIPRFSIREAKSITLEIENICEKKNNFLTLLLVQESYMRCLIQNEKWKQADRTSQSIINSLSYLPQAGSIHKSILYNGLANLSWQRKDFFGWKEWIKKSLHIMETAGLYHQLRLTNQTYGDALNKIKDQ